MSGVLGVDALAFAKQYTALVEALLSQGVPEPTAREEARTTALIILWEEKTPQDGGPCPVCGGTKEGFE